MKSKGEIRNLWLKWFTKISLKRLHPRVKPRINTTHQIRQGRNMSRQSIVLLGGTPPVITYTSEPVRVDWWFQHGQRMYSISIASSNFRGNLTIQASIKTKPTENDWFPISLNGQFYIQYPRNGLGAETSTLGFNFTGHFVWMRAIVDRSLVLPSDARPVMIAQCGFIDRILLNV
jgi:hypothetical protein